MDSFESNTSIVFKSWGEKNDSPVLALHGWLDNADSFDLIAPEIAKNHYVIAPDLPGHGESAHRGENSTYYLWEFAVDLLRIISANRWEKVTLLAHSMGTGIASIVASTIPKKIDKIVFIDGLGAPFVLTEGDALKHFKQSYKQREMLRKLDVKNVSAGLPVFTSMNDAIEDRMNSRVSPLTRGASKVLTHRSIKTTLNGLAWRYDQRLVLPEYHRFTEDQAQSFLAGIQCPTLVILGKTGLFTEDFPRSGRLEKIKEKELHWFNGGHHLHLEEEHPEIAQTISQFLKTN